MGFSQSKMNSLTKLFSDYIQNNQDIFQFLIGPNPESYENIVNKLNSIYNQMKMTYPNINLILSDVDGNVFYNSNSETNTWDNYLSKSVSPNVSSNNSVIRSIINKNRIGSLANPYVNNDGMTVYRYNITKRYSLNDIIDLGYCLLTNIEQPF